MGDFERRDAARSHSEIRRLWSEGARRTKHPYLERMGIDDPGNVRVVGDTLLIPMWAFGRAMPHVDPRRVRGVEPMCRGRSRGRAGSSACLADTQRLLSPQEVRLRNARATLAHRLGA